MRGHLVRLGISLAAFAAVLWFIDARRFLEIVAGAHPGWFALAFAVNLAGLYLAAHVLSSLCAGRVTGGAVFRVNLISVYVGTFVPGDIAAGLVSRLRYLGLATWQEVVHRTVVDRLVGLFTFSLLGAAAFPASAFRAPLGLVTLLLPAALAVGAAVAIAIARRPQAFLRRLPWLERWYYARFAPKEEVPPLELRAAAFGWAVLAQAVMCLIPLATLRAIGIEVSLLDSIVVAYLLTLAQLVPVFFAGIGIREVSAISLLGVLGVSAESAVAFSSLVLGLYILLALLGGVAQMRAESKAGDGAR
jgi:uncharacterized membrane protein YbhN (UPF0104 family)